MNKISEALERNFQSVLRKESDSEAMASIVQYVKFVLESPETATALKKLKDEEVADNKQFEDAVTKDEKEHTNESDAIATREREIILHKEATAVWSHWQDLTIIALRGDYFRDFDRKKYIAMCESMHNYLMNEVGKQGDANPAGEKNEFDFNENKGYLLINGKKILFGKTSKQYLILQVIFRDEKELLKDWQFDEIGDELGYEDIDEWKKIYDSINAIKLKIASKTGKEDFFITTTKSVSINKMYKQKS